MCYFWMIMSGDRKDSQEEDQVGHQMVIFITSGAVLYRSKWKWKCWQVIFETRAKYESSETTRASSPCRRRAGNRHWNSRKSVPNTPQYRLFLATTRSYRIQDWSKMSTKADKRVFRRWHRYYLDDEDIQLAIVLLHKTLYIGSKSIVFYVPKDGEDVLNPTCRRECKEQIMCKQT